MALKFALRSSVGCIWEIGSRETATLRDLIGQSFSRLGREEGHRVIDLFCLPWRQMANRYKTMREQQVEIAERRIEGILNATYNAIIVQGELCVDSSMELGILFCDSVMEYPGIQSF